LLGGMLCGFEPIGYLDSDVYCCRVLEQRIKDGLLADAPVHCGPIAQFIRGGYAGLYTGLAEIVTAGFPCQPFTTSGERRGADDERNQWPATRQVIEIVRPRFAFLENVAGLLTSGYFAEVLNDLAAMGFDAEWGVLGASDRRIGAPHKRKRLWVLAYSTESGRPASVPAEAGRRRRLPDQRNDPTEKHIWPSAPMEPFVVGESTGLDFAPMGRCGDCGALWCLQHHVHRSDCGCATNELHCKGCDEWTLEPDTGICEWCGRGGQTEPELARLSDGDASRVDRFEAIGNGQVPAVAALAFQILRERIE